MRDPLHEIFEEVAGQLDLTTKDVKDVVMDFFAFVRSRISRVAYRELSSFKGVKTNIPIPNFGKLVIRNKTDNRLQNDKRFKKNRKEKSDKKSS